METPFAEYKATELSHEKLEGYFVEPRYISKLYPNNVSFIIGQRGTGKTTLLKHLSTSYNQDCPNNKKRIGVYYRFDVNKMHSFSGTALSNEDWATLFSHCFSTEMCIYITDVLISMKNSLRLDKEEKICKEIRRLFYEDSPIIVSDLDSLKEYLKYVDYVSKKYKRNPFRADKPMISECEKTFEEYCSLISRDKNFKGVCIHFLFDEYENMLDYQKEFINSCAKNASSDHTYKICVRPYGMTNMKTRKSTEVLNEADDFKTLDYISDIIGSADDVEAFMRKACSRRLEKYYLERKTKYSEADLDIDRYFPKTKSDDELFDVLSTRTDYINEVRKQVAEIFNLNNAVYSESWGLLQMKLFLVLSQKRTFDFVSTVNSINTQDKKYSNYLNNYKKAILFLCFNELGIDYERSGFVDIINIAGNVVRYVLEICDYCFLCADISQDGKYVQVNEKMQTSAMYRVSQRRFQQITTVPQYGQEIKQMVLIMGQIFYMYHKDPQLKRFEPNHFSIYGNSSIGKKYSESEIKRALQVSVTSGVFEIVRSTKNRGDTDMPIENEEFRLHPIFTPYLRISWRRKQKCLFTMDEINTFLFGNDEDMKKILRKYHYETRDKMFGGDSDQLSLLDLEWD